MDIKIKNFKSIESVEFNFDQNLTIVGGNGSGKSTILRAVQFFVSCAQTVKYYGISPNSGGNTHGEKFPITPDQLLYSPSKNAESLISYVNAVKTEIEINPRGTTNKVIFSKGRNRAVTADLTNCNVEMLGNLEQPFSIFVPGLAGISSHEVEYSYGYLKKAILYGDSNRYFRNILQKLRDRDAAAFELLNQKAVSMFGIDEVVVEYQGQSDEFIEVFVRKGGKKIPIEIAGTGLLQVLQILGYAYLFKPHILLLDEPDSHLHPDNQQKLLSILDQLSTENDNLQILQTTHSRHMLSSDTKVLWIEGGRSKVAPSNSIVSVLIGIGALDSFATLNQANQKVMIISEDENTECLRAILNAARIDPSTYGNTIFSSRGSSTEDTVFAFLQSSEHVVKENVVVVMDRDAYTQDELNIRKAALEKLGVVVMFTPHYDMESCLVENDELVGRFLDIPIAEVRSKVDGIIEANKNQILKDWVNARADACNKIKNKCDPGTLAVQFENQWTLNRRSVVKGKFLRKKINSEFGGSEAIETRIQPGQNFFPSLTDWIAQKVGG